MILSLWSRRVWLNCWIESVSKLPPLCGKQMQRIPSSGFTLFDWAPHTFLFVVWIEQRLEVVHMSPRPTSTTPHSLSGIDSRSLTNWRRGTWKSRLSLYSTFQWSTSQILAIIHPAKKKKKKKELTKKIPCLEDNREQIVAARPFLLSRFPSSVFLEKNKHNYRKIIK